MELLIEFVLFEEGAAVPIGGDGGATWGEFPLPGEGGPPGGLCGAPTGGFVPLRPPEGGPDGGKNGAGGGIPGAAECPPPLGSVELAPDRLLRLEPGSTVVGVKEKQPDMTAVSRLMVDESPEGHAE